MCTVFAGTLNKKVLTCKRHIHHSPLSELAGNQCTPHIFVAFLAFDHLSHPLADLGVQLVVLLLV